ncbi:ABC transporter ATP-binding protein [Chromatiales bacterium (ex Bugula neritina AB1)]|nr:ABC transporter ATP-binding protein [Chromatiales bacterium (ex Bugula neritina AB1)]
MNSGRTFLEVCNVSKSFGGLVAVNCLSFTVNEQEVLGIIGPNGSGKTTVLNLISGVFPVSDGSIRLQGTDLTDKSAHKIARAGVARTFQLVRVLKGLSVIENVTAGAVFGYRRRWGKSAELHARQLLERVGLADKQHQPVSALTYIDQKRVELARALAGDPQVLLLDEWLAGLNPSELQTGIELIESLSKEGRTIILVEHVMDAIRTLCHRCIVVNSGQLIAEGTPAAVLAAPAVVAAYLGDD